MSVGESDAPVMREIIITDNSEYCLVGGECIAVRKPKTVWTKDHMAVGAHLVSRLTRTPNGVWLPNLGVPALGDRMVFSNDIITSPVRQVMRVMTSIRQPAVDVRTDDSRKAA